MSGVHDARATTERYDYSAMSPETVRQAADEDLAEAERLIAQVVRETGSRTFENTLVPLSDAAAAVWTADGRGALVRYVHPDAGVREAAREARDRTEKWRTGLPMRDDVAAAVRAYAETDDAAGLTGARRRVLDLWLQDLQRAGHELDPVGSGEADREAFAITGFPFPDGAYQPASFHHLLNYDAGYYSYLWAQVFGDDMFSAFQAEGLLSSDVGRRYRAEVLEPTWSVPGRDRVRNFLGRDPSERAFLERLGIAVKSLEGV